VYFAGHGHLFGAVPGVSFHKSALVTATIPAHGFVDTGNAMTRLVTITPATTGENAAFEGGDLATASWGRIPLPSPSWVRWESPGPSRPWLSAVTVRKERE
jgi:hypothetical protein